MIYVIISAFKAEEFIEECLNSVKNQSVKCQIILGIDGCNDTLLKVKEIKNNYTNLRVYVTPTNVGVYVMFNSLLDFVQEDDYVQFFGADDVMNNDMLEKMSSYEVAYSRHVGTLFVKKSIITKVGGFREWRIFGDRDIVERIKLIGYKVELLPLLFFRREHPNQLTKLPETCEGSELREFYKKIVKENKIAYVEPIKTKLWNL